MRIWCCLCFGEEEEEEYSKREMIGEKEELGFDNYGDVVDGENVPMRSESLDAQGSGLSLGVLEESSSSLAAAAVGSEVDALDRGGHCKRPKVNSLAMEGDIPFVCVPAQEGNPFGLSEEEYERMLNRAGQNLQPVSDGEERDHLVDSTSCEVNEVDQVSAEMNDLENQMDLTDDLLHMVFSFLDHINLCKAAKVCRQWHTASAHEDFWRNLEILTLGKGQLWEAFFQALPDCTMLNSLIVTDAVLGNGHQDIPIYHDRLRHLQIVKCRMVRISV
ncbi:hypothetical protein M8C21_023275, partial [Ambrosia artemisiifolia]